MAARPELDVVLLVPTCGPDVPVPQVLLGAQIGLREGRTPERNAWFLADDHHLATEALVPQGRCRVAPGESSAEDDDGIAA